LRLGCVRCQVVPRFAQDSLEVSNTYDAVVQLITQRSLVQIQPPQPNPTRGYSTGCNPVFVAGCAGVAFCCARPARPDGGWVPPVRPPSPKGPVGVEGNTLLLNEVEALLSDGRRLAPSRSGFYLEVRGYADAARGSTGPG
jgi:hypothetical protein